MVRRHGGGFGQHTPTAYLSIQDLDVLQAATERLLPDARLSPARYREIVRDHPGGVEAGLVAVHGATRSGLGWQLEGRPRAER